MTSAAGQWDVLIPVKPTADVKSRLHPLHQRSRLDLVSAFGYDVMSTLARSGRVARIAVVGRSFAPPRTANHELLWIDEASLPIASTAPAASTASNTRHEEAVKLNDVLALAVKAMRANACRPVAVVTADLPALRLADLIAVFDAASDLPASFVRDADGRGTTMLLASAQATPVPCFGPGSAMRHQQLGAVDISAACGPGARRDVDTAVDLRDALLLGVGSKTTRALARDTTVLATVMPAGS